MIPSDTQQLAIQARLNMALGAHIYDELFGGFECGLIFEDTAIVSVSNPVAATIIEAQYNRQVASAIQMTMSLPINAVKVYSGNPSTTQGHRQTK